MKKKNPTAESTAQLKLREEQETAAAKARIERVNEQLAELLTRRTQEYEEASLGGGTEEVAQAVSRRWPELKVTATYCGGEPSLQIAPQRVHFHLPDSPYYICTKALEAERALQQIEQHWPTLAQVRLFLEGFRAGSKAQGPGAHRDPFLMQMYRMWGT